MTAIWADEPTDGLDAAMAMAQTEPGRELVAGRELKIWQSAQLQTQIKQRRKNYQGGTFEVRTRPTRDHMFRVDVLVKWMPDPKD